MLIARFLQFNGPEHTKPNGFNVPDRLSANRYRALSRPFSSSRNSSNSRHFCQSGFTIIEVLVVIAVLAIIVGFASQASENASYRTNLRVAEEIVSQSVRMARNTARAREKEIVLTFRPEPGEDLVHIEIQSLSGDDSLLLTDDIQMPAGIVILSPDKEFRFDHRGVVDEAGTIVFADASHETEIRQVQLSKL